MKRYRRTIFSQYLVILLLLAAFVGFAVLTIVAMTQVPFIDQFAIPWAAGRSWLLDGISPYDPAVIRLAVSTLEESGYAGQLPETQVLIQPLMTLFFYLPFSLVPYGISRVAWVILLSICVGMIGLIGIELSGLKLSTSEKLGIILMVVFWLPGVLSILGGYLSPLIIALLLAGIYLALNGQDTTAGLILALTFSSVPTSAMILTLMLVWSISQKRWSILSGYFSGVAFLVVISFLVFPAWFMEWAAIMLNTFTGWNWIHTPIMDLAALLPGIADFLTILIHGVLIVYALVLIITILNKSGRIFFYKLAAFFILIYLLHVQGSIKDLLFMVPAMLLLFRFWTERWGMVGRLVSWFVFFIVSGGPWFLVLPGLDFTQAINILLISMYYPLIVLIGLIWIRWWALRVPKLPFESL
jgi:hypothetical protein